jgi:hypothetical protein
MPAPVVGMIVGQGIRMGIRAAAPAIGRGLAWAGRKALPNVLRALPMLANVASSTIPRVETKVSLTVYGQPHAKKADLLFFGYAVIFGLLRKRLAQGFELLPPSSMIMASFSLHEKTVHLEVSFGASPLVNVLNGLGGQVEDLVRGNGNFLANSLPVLTGIPETVTGGEFAGLNQLERIVLGNGPALAAAGQVLLTDSPTKPSPAPGGDKISRGLLEGLIWESLLHPPKLYNHSGDDRLKEDNPVNKEPGSPGSYFSLKDGIPKPDANPASRPAWKKFWADRNRPTPTDAG